jgi:hypothetical protein
VKDNTDGMIPEILDQIPEEAVMYLVNALAFDGEWTEPYMDFQVSPGDFTLEDGTKEPADFMYSEEYRYLEDGDAAARPVGTEGGAAVRFGGDIATYVEQWLSMRERLDDGTLSREEYVRWRDRLGLGGDE